MGSAPIRDDLTVWVGRTFGPYGWRLRDNDGAPLRSKTGVSAVAQLRPHARSEHVLATWATEIVERVEDGEDQPTVLALITLSSASTSELGELDVRTGVYDVLIDREDDDNPPGVEGRVEIRWPVTRE